MSSRKREKVDLMEVYKDSQLVELSKDKKINLNIFPIGEKEAETWGAFEMGNDFDELNEEESKKLEENIKLTMETIDEKPDKNEVAFNWDDI